MDMNKTRTHQPAIGNYAISLMPTRPHTTPWLQRPGNSKEILPDGPVLDAALAEDAAFSRQPS
jgi:hypothetical protein